MNIELVLRGTLATIVKILWEYLSIQSFQYRLFFNLYRNRCCKKNVNLFNNLITKEFYLKLK